MVESSAGKKVDELVERKAVVMVGLLDDQKAEMLDWSDSMLAESRAEMLAIGSVLLLVNRWDSMWGRQKESL
jgi:hypothetical protein